MCISSKKFFLCFKIMDLKELDEVFTIPSIINDRVHNGLPYELVLMQLVMALPEPPLKDIDEIIIKEYAKFSKDLQILMIMDASELHTVTIDQNYHIKPFGGNKDDGWWPIQKCLFWTTQRAIVAEKEWLERNQPTCEKHKCLKPSQSFLCVCKFISEDNYCYARFIRSVPSRQSNMKVMTAIHLQYSETRTDIDDLLIDDNLVSKFIQKRQRHYNLSHDIVLMQLITALPDPKHVLRQIEQLLCSIAYPKESILNTKQFVMFDCRQRKLLRHASLSSKMTHHYLFWTQTQAIAELQTLTLLSKTECENIIHKLPTPTTCDCMNGGFTTVEVVCYPQKPECMNGLLKGDINWIRDYV